MGKRKLTSDGAGPATAVMRKSGRNRKDAPPSKPIKSFLRRLKAARVLVKTPLIAGDEAGVQLTIARELRTATERALAKAGFVRPEGLNENFPTWSTIGFVPSSDPRWNALKKIEVDHAKELEAIDVALGIGASLSQSPTVIHSPDFRSVNWFGTHHMFTVNQALVVKILWAGWELGTPAIAGATLLEAAGIAGNRVNSVFNGHAAWQTMITSPSKGAYCLSAPEKSEIA